MIGAVPVGKWELAFDDDMEDVFQDHQIEDIVVVLTYSGFAPEWPA